MTWASAIALGLWFAVNASGKLDPSALLLPAVIPVALIVSSVGALLMLPFAIWASRTGWRNIYRYGPLLWSVLAVYVFFVLPSAGKVGLFGLVLLGAVGLVGLGLVPPRDSIQETS